MDMSEFSKLFPQKMAELKQFTEGEDIKHIAGVEAVNYFKESFANEGFTDETLEPWKEVERRNPDSPWYGFDGFNTGGEKSKKKEGDKTIGKFSSTKATAKILHGAGQLDKSITYSTTPTGAKITSDLPYSAVHQFGLKAKIFGKHEFTMPARPFMGKSKTLKANIENKIKKEMLNIIKK